MREPVHFVVPAGFDDPSQPSGGNYYDRRIRDGLRRRGWTVRTWQVPGFFPRPEPRHSVAISEVMAGIPDGAIVLADGIIASALPDVFVPAARRLPLVVLVHMTLAAMASAELDAEVLEREVLSSAAAVITTSRWMREELLAVHSLPADRVHVVRPGGDVADLASERPDGGRLLCVATVAEHKGHDTLLGALERIADLPWHCTFVGPLDREPAFVARLRRRLDDSPIRDRVAFTGTLAGSALSNAYADSDLVVLASRCESYGMVLTEALACGIPVVATDVGGIPEAVGGEAGLLVRPDDETALADVLSRWLQDSDLRRRLRAAARDRRTMLPTWRGSADRVAEVLARVA